MNFPDLEPSTGAGNPVPLRKQLCGLALGLVLAWPGSTCAVQQPPYVLLRDLTLLADETVEHFTPAGVVLASGKRLSWDRIERASVDPGRRQAFDAMLREYGTPLFRIKQRLNRGDSRQLESMAALLLEKMEPHPGASQLMLHCALTRGRLGQGRRAAAVEPMLHSIALARELDPQSRRELGFPLIVPDPESGVWEGLLPVFFDREAASATIDQFTPLELDRFTTPTDWIYLASLGIAADRPQWARSWIDRLGQASGLGAPWKTLLESQWERLDGRSDGSMQSLRNQYEQYPDVLRAVALYNLGAIDVESSDRSTAREGLLSLLIVPAQWKHRFPELSAACIQAALDSAPIKENEAARTALRRELFRHYGNTYWGRRAKTDDSR